MSKYILITSTFDNKETLNKVVYVLLEKRLVSCCQVSEINSLYHWQGKIEKSNEFLLIMKSKNKLYKQIEQEILKLHNYDTPQIVCFKIKRGYTKYLDWIEQETI